MTIHHGRGLTLPFGMFCENHPPRLLNFYNAGMVLESLQVVSFNGQQISACIS